MAFPLHSLLLHLRLRADSTDRPEATDGQLVERYVGSREEAAFATLVQRHGPMVLGVCRRVVGDAHAAEDAFQATFLVFVRKAGTLAHREQVAGWLHGVALRTAQKARLTAGRRAAREKAMDDLTQVVGRTGDTEAAAPDLPVFLDEELCRLPARYRLPVVLCDVQGLTRQEAARKLDCPEGTLSSRLARARDLLRRRLTRRGVALPAVPLSAAMLGDAAVAALPATLVATTVRTGMELGPASTRVISLVEGVLRTMFIAKVRLAALCAFCAAALALGVGVLVWGLTGVEAAPAQTDGQETAQEDFGEPIPAVAEKIKELLPEAASLSTKAFEKLSGAEGPPKLETLEDQSLTAALLYLEMPAAPDAPARKEFRYLSDTLNPAHLAAAISMSQAKGYGSFLQPTFIKEVTCRVKDGVARGKVTFRGMYYRDFWDQLRGKGQPIYEGCIEFMARRVEDNWRVEEFRLPGYKIKVVRQANGNWRHETLADKSRDGM